MTSAPGNTAAATRACISRRALVAGGAAAIASLWLAGGRSALAQAAAAPHRLKIGAAEILLFSDGSLSLPTSLALPGLPEAEIGALLGDKDAASRGFPMAVNVALIRTGRELILVDTGGGPDFMPTLGKLGERLEAAGIAPEAITTVVFTHAHADHLWGVIDPLGGGTLFEKARHLMTVTERDFWLGPDVANRVPSAFQPMAIGTGRRLKAIADRIEPAKDGQEIAPGIALIDTPGHTPGHMSVLVRSGSDQALICGDALTHAIVSFAAPQWRWGSDLDPDRAIDTRKRLLDRLATDKLALVGYHLPWPGVGRVERRDAAFRYVPASA